MRPSSPPNWRRRRSCSQRPSAPIPAAACCARRVSPSARRTSFLASLPEDEAEPRADLKKGASAFPEIDRRHKGDPLVGLRPTIDGRLRRPDGLRKMRADVLTFNQDDSAFATTFSLGEGEAPGPDSVRPL